MLPDALPEPNFGPSGREVYDRTYSRPLPDGSKENFAQTVRRMVAGNMAFVYGDDEDKWTEVIHEEAAELCGYIYSMAILPAGRHWWATGVKGQQHTSNCFVAPTDDLADHVRFMILTLLCGGGVGSRYGLDAHNFWPPARPLRLHLVCDPAHPDHAALKAAGVLSEEYGDEWMGAYPVVDSREGWSDALVDLVTTFYRDNVRHSNRVYDLAHIRPAGARLKSFGGTASGPVPFARMLHDVAAVLNGSATTRHHLTGLDVMEIDHAIASAVVAGGVRRSARMSIMHWTDTEIMRFIDCKQDTGSHWTTNISVAIDDAFLASAEKEGTQARRVLDAVIGGMLRNGEPGLFNQDKANEKEIGKVLATNPCVTGDTVIATFRGPRTFAELAESERDVLVYSWHPDTKLPVLRWMRRPHKTRADAALLRVEFDSGLVVRCTPDHSFYSFRGKKVRADELKAGKAVRAYSASRDLSGHERVHAWDSERNAAVHQWTHRMRWEAEYGSIPEGLQIAHLDGDGSNNDLDNLALMTDLGHRRYDMPKRQAAGMDGHCRNHKVVSVSPAGREDVYNGCVDDAHAYIILDPSPVSGHMSGIVSANCGEIALEPYEPCVLGQINMEKFAMTGLSRDQEASDMLRAHALLTRFLIRATFAPTNFAESRAIMDRNRRIGLGHTGIAGYMAIMGMRYSEAADHAGLEMLLTGLKRQVDQTAANYAFELRIPQPIKRTAIAPTGTISKLPGCTEGIAPIFGRYYVRRMRFSKTNADQAARVEELRALGHEVEDDLDAADTAVVSFPMEDVLLGKVADPGVVEDQDEISLDARLAMQELYQRCFADNAVSNTVTLDPARTSVREVRGALLRWMPSLKGITIFPWVSRPQSPYEKLTKEEFDAMTAPKGVDTSNDENCAGGACPVR